MAAVAVKNTQSSLRENEKKWTRTLMDAGWTAIPSVILERQKAFGLDAIDVNIILHLASHWWFADALPYPGKKLMAEAMKISTRTVQRRIARMEEAGLIKRIPRRHPKYGQQSNAYDFSGLIEEAKPYAREALAARKKAREERQKRRGRLRVVNPEE
jgi:DNA-binding HxlR family transcriptional regulator